MRHNSVGVGGRETPRRKSSVAAGAVSVAFQPTYVLIAVVCSVIDGLSTTFRLVSSQS
jgi:hypothetical protein